MIHEYRLCAGFVLRSTKAVSANSPPSAAVVGPHDDETYLTMTISTKAQTMSESAPENCVLAHIADRSATAGRRRAGKCRYAEYDAERGECQAGAGTEAKRVPPCGVSSIDGRVFVRARRVWGLKAAKPRGQSGWRKIGSRTGSVAESFSLRPTPCRYIRV